MCFLVCGSKNATDLRHDAFTPYMKVIIRYVRFWEEYILVYVLLFRRIKSVEANLCSAHKQLLFSAFSVFLASFFFTQLFTLSLLSKSFFWRISPAPPGAPNFSTMVLVFRNCSSLTRCWTHFKYASRVCFSGGTGTLGSTWCKKKKKKSTCGGNEGAAAVSYFQYQPLLVHGGFTGYNPGTFLLFLLLFIIRTWVNN